MCSSESSRAHSLWEAHPRPRRAQPQAMARCGTLSGASDQYRPHYCIDVQLIHPAGGGWSKKISGLPNNANDIDHVTETRARQQLCSTLSPHVGTPGNKRTFSNTSVMWAAEVVIMAEVAPTQANPIVLSPEDHTELHPKLSAWGINENDRCLPPPAPEIKTTHLQ